LLLPADLLREQVEMPAADRKMSLGHWPLDRVRADQESIIAAAQILSEATSPVVVAGGGVHSAGAAAELADLQNEASLPVFTTNMGKGTVDEFHTLSAGVLGSLVGPRSLGRHTRPLLDEADAVLLIGTRTNQNGTDNWRNFNPNAKVIHIDVDPVEIGRNYEALRLTGDARENLVALRSALVRMDLQKRQQARIGVEKRIAAAWKAFESDRAAVAYQNSSPIRPERVMTALQSLLTPRTTVVADASYSSMWIAGQLRALAPGMRFVTPRGLAGLGWGLPLALGAKLARPSEPVVALVGDGGFAHSWAELETMVRNQLNVTVIVLNNGILGFQRDAETVKFGQYTTACHLGSVDHTQIAEACGCPAVRISTPDQIEDALKRGLSGIGPLLIEVETDPGAHPPLSLFARMDDVA
jgi:acetolactate synthase-1/2/3 large subunit